MQNDPSENNTKLTFQISDVGSDTAYTDFIKHELTRDYLRSLTRRGTSKVDAFVTVLTTDDYRVKVQPVAFTTKRADHSQQHAIRRTMIDLVEEAAEDRTFRELMASIVEGRLSSAIYNEAKTIYPLRRVEIQKSTLEAHPEEVYEEEETAAERPYDDLVDSIVEGRLSSAIYNEAKDIYPLRRVEVQKATLEAHPEEVAAEEEAAVTVDEDEADIDT